MGIREQVIQVLKDNIQASSFDSRGTKIYGKEESADLIIPAVRADSQREIGEWLIVNRITVQTCVGLDIINQMIAGTWSKSGTFKAEGRQEGE